MRIFLSALFFAFLSACASAPPLRSVDHVDLGPFMGVWYVNAHIPTSFEKDCTNAVEYYRWRNPGEKNARPGIENLFYCENAHSPEKVKMSGYAWVHDQKTNAEWRIEFIWPFVFQYWVIGLSPSGDEVVIAHPSRDYLWIMSRTPNLPRARIDFWMKAAAEQGFPAEKLRIVPFTPGFKMTEVEVRRAVGRRPL